MSAFDSFNGPRLALHAWLTARFDGAQHSVGPELATFPACAVRFDQAAIDQPMSTSGTAAEIRVMIHPHAGPANEVSAGQDLQVDWLQIEFEVRARHAGSGQSEWAAFTVADLLVASLDNAAEAALDGLYAWQVWPWFEEPNADHTLLKVRARCQHHQKIRLNAES